MAEFGARWDEIRADIVAPQTADLVATPDKGAQLAQATARYTTFLSHFNSYLDWRDRALNDALEIIKEESSSATAASQQAKWINLFSKNGDEAYKRVMDCAQDTAQLAPNLRQWALGVAGHESQFFWQLGRAPLAQIAGQLQEYAREFQTERANLEAKWKALGDQDRSIDQKVADASRQILAEFTDIIARLVAEQRGLADKIKDVKYDPSAPVTGTFFNTLGHIAKAAGEKIAADLERLKKDTGDYVETLMEMYRAEDTVVVIFTQLREAVREFLKKTSLDTAGKNLAEAKSLALEAAGLCPTARLKDDARRFIEKATPCAEAFMDRFSREYSAFISANQGIFVGPVSSQTFDDLLEVSQREGMWKDLEAVNVQTRLAEIYAGFPGVEVSLEGLTPEDKDKLQTFWQTLLEPMMRGMVAAKEDRLRDRIPEYFKDRLKSMYERVKGSRGGLE